MVACIWSAAVARSGLTYWAQAVKAPQATGSALGSGTTRCPSLKICARHSSTDSKPPTSGSTPRGRDARSPPPPSAAPRGLRVRHRQREQTLVGGAQLVTGVEERLRRQADAFGDDGHEPTPDAARGRDEWAALTRAALPSDEGRGRVLMPGRRWEPAGHHLGDLLLLVGRRLAGAGEAKQMVAEVVEVAFPAAYGVAGRLPEWTLERLVHHRGNAGQRGAPLGGKRQRLPLERRRHEPQAAGLDLGGTGRHGQSVRSATPEMRAPMSAGADRLLRTPTSSMLPWSRRGHEINITGRHQTSRWRPARRESPDQTARNGQDDTGRHDQRLPGGQEVGSSNLPSPTEGAGQSHFCC
jgi:hypothetical protein